MQGKTTDQLRGSWHNFSKYRPLIRELVTRDLKVKYLSLIHISEPTRP